METMRGPLRGRCNSGRLLGGTGGGLEGGAEGGGLTHTVGMTADWVGGGGGGWLGRFNTVFWRLRCGFCVGSGAGCDSGFDGGFGVGLDVECGLLGLSSLSEPALDGR
ncbi:rh180 [macacine betaherpesvirus 3]|uniref:Rh180 n=1 Tax=Rhesus cytomegalovirus (strain 68-1) TaxID=47929 RepID=Q7TFG2_RHCM6|nr:rh180 [macacine betaherpesvirus 3]AAP50702.1 rh180 [macacine betaherpesvirus 3]